VTATLAAKDASDIVEVLRFLARYVSNRRDSIRRIEAVLNQGIVSATGTNLLAGRFSYLNATGLGAAQLFDETLSRLFNAPGGGSMYVENLQGAAGEVALRVGNNDPFGLIYVGDDKKLTDICDARDARGTPKYPELTVSEREFSGSLFDQISRPSSTVNLLIGSKKFNEGWNSWRVSTMGLLNVGATEGSQIIQLFGRGVRLKGYSHSLKRSGRAPLPDDLHRPEYLGLVETLGIFGIHANYMEQFRDFLAEEGLPGNNDRYEFAMPAITNLGTETLKTIRLTKTIDGTETQSGDAFRTLGPLPTLAKPDPALDPSTAYLQKNKVILNWYPKIRALKSEDLTGGDAMATPNRTHLTAGHIAFLDLDALYNDLQSFKGERGWHNLNLTRSALGPLLLDQSWYELLVPEYEMSFDVYEKVDLWQDIALSLLKKYTERYYFFRRREWELPHLEYQDLTPDDPNLIGAGASVGDPYYRILVDRSQNEIVAKLEELRALILGGGFAAWEFRGLKAVWFDRHLYKPLLGLASPIVEISPVPLNKGEREFIEDLKSFSESAEVFLADKDLYVLRNQSRARGVGFFEAGNFHPDFILWLLYNGHQHVLFVDPKGILNLGPNDPKIQFHQTIKEIETRLGDATIRLHSFIVSNTPSYAVTSRWGIDKAAMISMHILFREEDRATYIRDMLSAAVAT
jgi:hypothetical protein